VYSVSDIIDLTRYPIDRLDSAEATALIASCQEALESGALCCFPGFIKPDALKMIVREESSLEDVAYPYEASRSAYLEPDDSLPEDHPHLVEQESVGYRLVELDAQLVATGLRRQGDGAVAGAVECRQHTLGPA